MMIAIIFLVSALASVLTFFSGFGLGTLLMPVFAWWFPLEVAVAATALVHFFNNAFKLILLGKYFDKKIIVNFGLPALVAAVLGAYCLRLLSHQQSFFDYDLFGKTYYLYPVKTVIAGLILGFTLMEILPYFKNKTLAEKWLPLGGVLSGFFGGLSGHQGALRSLFLVRAGLSKEVFLSSGVTLALMVDCSRLIFYAKSIPNYLTQERLALVIIATTGALLGAVLGNKIFKKITFDALQILVTICLILFATGLGAGLI